MDSSAFLVWRDREARPGPEHMAIDQGLLDCLDRPVIRFYGWEKPELTLGFFTPLASVSKDNRPFTRRWTGGGIVEHGDDVTFSLSLPRAFLPPGATTSDRYRLIHLALASALEGHTGIAPVAGPSPATEGMASSGPGTCFTEPVAWDLLAPGSGNKIAGGAQRRSRRGVLHQGSLRLPPEYRDPEHPWVTAFLAALLQGSDLAPAPWTDPGPAFWDEVQVLRRERYEAPAWRQRF